MVSSRRELGLLTFLFGRNWFPLVIQLLFTAVFILLIFGGLGANTTDMKFAGILRNTNLANLVVWSYWWPLVIVSAVIFGRIWCAVCPMELVTSGLSKFGLKRKVPGWMRSGWLITVFYALILVIGIHTFAIHRVPFRMALYLILLFGLAVVFGLLFKKRAFCNHLCPIGPLLGFYGFCSPFEIRVRDRQVCHDCRGKECISSGNYYNFVGRSCTSELYPATLWHNRDCITCSQCFKSCPFDNVGVFARMPFKDIFSGLRLTSSQTFLLYIISGFVVYEILSEWQTTKDILAFIPNQVADKLGVADPHLTGLLTAVVIFLGYPLLWWIVPAFINRFSNPDTGVWEYMKSTAVFFVPVAAGAHLFKSMLKTTSRIPFIEHSIDDPNGIETAKAIAAGTLFLDNSFVSAVQPYLTFCAITLFLISIAVSLAALTRKCHAGEGISVFPAATGVLTYCLIFVITIVWWRF